MTRNELLQSEEYWLLDIQLSLFNELEKYMTEKQLNRKQFADQLGVSKGYVSQVLNGNYDHRLSSLVKLALKIGKAPILEFKSINKVIWDDKHKNDMTNIQVNLSLHIDKKYNEFDYSLPTVSTIAINQ